MSSLQMIGNRLEFLLCSDRTNREMRNRDDWIEKLHFTAMIKLKVIKKGIL